MPDLVMDREYGTAYGYVGLEELGNVRIADVEGGAGINAEAIQRTLDFTNRRNEMFRSRLAEDVANPQEWYLMPGGGTLQDIDEHDNPIPRVELSAYETAYPIRGGGDATGTDRISRILQTFGESNRAVQRATLADKRWHINYMMAAIFGNTGYRFLDRGRRKFRGAGVLNVKPLANGDDTQYLTNEGAGVDTDNHYFAQTAAISPSANPLPMIYDDLVEHQENPGEVEIYVGKGLVADIEALPNFKQPRDVRVSYGSGESTVSEGDKGIGDRYIGLCDDCNIIRMNALPAGYMLALVRGLPVLGYRQYPAPQVQGLFQETHMPDGNHQETRFLRYGGYGVRNRTAAAVMQIGSATYTAPNLPMKLS